MFGVAHLIMGNINKPIFRSPKKKCFSKYFLLTGEGRTNKYLPNSRLIMLQLLDCFAACVETAKVTSIANQQQFSSAESCLVNAFF